jgi:DNA-binding NtrC family response regulator
MHGFRLCIFTDGLAALKHFSLNSKAHRIVISDIRLPDMTRNEFVRQIWKSNPKVRLILIGDEGSPDSNADTFLKKPFSLEKLRNIVQEYYQQEKEL